MGTTNLINTAAAWSTGASGSQHQLKTGPLSLMITTPNNINAMEIAGTEGGLINEGKIFMYKDLYIYDANLTVEGTASITGNLTVLGSSNFTENVNIFRSAPNGGEVALGITNNGNSAYSSLYLQTRLQSGSSTNETGQIFVGAGSMVVQTRANHPINFKAYADDLSITVPNSLTISNNATRDVVITAPLIVNNNVTINGFLAAKPYVGVYVSSSGSVSTNVKPGYVTPTVAKTTGQYIFTLPTAHPSGVNYEVFVQQRMIVSTTANALYGVYVTSSTSFTVWSKSTANALTDSDFYVYTVP